MGDYRNTYRVTKYVARLALYLISYKYDFEYKDGGINVKFYEETIDLIKNTVPIFKNVEFVKL